MDKEMNRKFGVKRETRTDSENEPSRVYRPRTLKARPVSEEGQEDGGSRTETTPTESNHSKENFSNENTFREKKSFNSEDSNERKVSIRKKESEQSEERSTYRPRTFSRPGKNEDESSDSIDSKKQEPSRGEDHESTDFRPSRSQDSSEDSPFKRKEDRPSRRRDNDSSEGRFSRSQRSSDDRPFRKSDDRRGSFKEKDNERTSRRIEGKPTGYRSSRDDRDNERNDRRSRDNRDERGDSRKSFGRRNDDDKPRYGDRVRDNKKPFGSKSTSEGKLRLVLPDSGERKFIDRPVEMPKRDYDDKPVLEVDSDGLIRLNKFISNTGLCSRREADEYIQKGMITVNGEVIDQLGTKIDPSSEICFKGRKLETEHKVYILLNKPKDYITTVEDPNAKRTVMELIEGACTERVYPVGRLDRNSTGLLLLTNDGEMTKRLTHPSFMKRKIYYVGLDKALTREDMEKTLAGIEVEGEMVKADAIDYTEGSDGTEIGIEIHSGQNRVVRNMFASLGYKVSTLDRVYFAGLTKKNLPRGKWRFLTQKEINMLKMNRFE